MQDLKNTWITTKVLWFLYFFYNIWFTIKWKLFDESFGLYGLYVHLISLLIIYCYSEAINSFVKNNFVRILLGIFLIFTYFIGGKYHYRVKTSFDYSVFIDNISEAFSVESSKIVLETFKPKDLYQAFALIPIFLFVQFKWKSFTRTVKVNYKKFAITLTGLMALIIFAPYPFGEIGYCAKSAWDFHFGRMPEAPGVTWQKTKHISDREKARPHIFLVALESFSARYVERSEDGKVVTPIFNSLIKEGIYVENFYGNSVQTTKGHFSMFCSRIPLYKGKASYKVDGSKLNCLPKLLEKAGYKSLFHQSYGDLTFDNTLTFNKAIGFNKFMVSRNELLTEKQRAENIWGWGMQDDLSYPQFLDNFKNLHENESKPIFSFMATISHHMKFRDVPKSQRYLYPHPGDKRQYFLNSLHLSDKYLGTFISELKERGLYENSIIILTGDHSFPGGEHGYYDNQASFYEEFFRVPLLIIWKNKIEARRIKERTFSHLDLLPTIFDLIGENLDEVISGKSILKEENTFAHLVQPYNGMYLGAVKWPYKLVWERRSDRYKLFDLSKDPDEKNPIDNDSVIKSYQSEIGRIISNSKNLIK